MRSVQIRAGYHLKTVRRSASPPLHCSRADEVSNRRGSSSRLLRSRSVPCCRFALGPSSGKGYRSAGSVDHLHQLIEPFRKGLR